MERYVPSIVGEIRAPDDSRAALAGSTTPHVVGDPAGRYAIDLLQVPLISTHAHPTLAVIAMSALVGCADASEGTRYDDSPDEVAIVGTVPEAGAVEIPSDVQLDLCWSDLLDPRSIGDLDATISSGGRVFDTDLQLQLFAWRGPRGSDLLPENDGPWCSGSVLSITPVDPLQPGARHRLRLRADPVGWNGESIDLDTPGWTQTPQGEDVFYLEFDVAAEPERENDPEEAIEDLTLSTLFEPDRVFDPQRAMCSCHTEADSLATTLLDMSNAEAAYADLVLDPRVRETGYTMVTPRRPSESFLIHKLLRDADGSAIAGILGHPMPQNQDPLPYPDLVDIAEWIESGAKR